MTREMRVLNSNERKRIPLPISQEKLEFGNRLIHVESLCEIIETSAVCKFCGGNLKVEETTRGIATSLALKCNKCKREKKLHNFTHELKKTA